MNSGGVVILNPGFESEEKIKVSEKEGLKEFRIYDKDDVLIDVKDFEYTYETDVNSVININVSAEDGYDLKAVSYTHLDVYKRQFISRQYPASIKSCLLQILLWKWEILILRY